jgi:osmotically-inducible protein OsmY
MRDRYNQGSRDRQDRDRQGRWGEQRFDQRSDEDRGSDFGRDRWEGERNYGNQNNLGGDRDDSAIFGTNSGPGYGSNYDRGRDWDRPDYGRDRGSSGTSQYGRSDYTGRGSPGQGQREDFGGQSRDRSGFDQQSGYGRSGSGQQGGYGQQAEHGRSDYGYGYGGSQSGNQWGNQSSGQSQSRGLHRGKGPKGYQRSDERLKEMICERLREDPEIDASEVTVTVLSGTVTFEGTVDSRRVKNAIEDIAEQLDATHVQNNLRVTRGEAGGGTGTSGTTGFRGLGMESGDASKQKRN